MHSGQQRPISPRPPEGWSGALSNLNPITRVMSESSTTGTPRSSSEFYSISNHSDETLTSEIPYPNQQNGRLLPKPSHARHTSSARHSPRRASEPETLMMAYAQTMGYFILDGSLVNAAPFEEVKRKGVQGGGVSVASNGKSSGILQSFQLGQYWRVVRWTARSRRYEFDGPDESECRVEKHPAPCDATKFAVRRP